MLRLPFPIDLPYCETCDGFIDPAVAEIRWVEQPGRWDWGLYHPACGTRLAYPSLRLRHLWWAARGICNSIAFRLGVL